MHKVIHHVESEHALGCLGPALVMVFRRGVLAEDFQRLRRVAEAMGQPFLGLSVMSEEAPPGLPKPAREALIEMLEATKHDIVASSVVIRGTSLRTTIVRSMLSTAILAARLRKPYRVFASVEDATRFVSAAHGQPALARELGTFVDELFAAVERA